MGTRVHRQDMNRVGTWSADWAAPYSRMHLGKVSVLFTCLLVACGPSSQTQVSGPEVRIEAPGPGAAEYATEPVDGPVTEPRIDEEIQAAARDTGQQLVRDSRLSTLAEWIGGEAQDGQLPSHAVVSFFTQHLGMVQTPHFLVRTLQGAAQWPDATEAVAAFLGRRTYDRYGLAITTHGDQRVMVIALAHVPIQLEPLARRQSAGMVRLEGTVGEGFRQPVLVVTNPAGQIERTPLGNGPGFLTQLPVSQTGAHQVEILASGQRGATVLANFPVYVGEAPPDAITLRTAGVGEAGDAGAVAESLLALLNETRTDHGLSTLETRTDLTAVATAHSTDMRDAGFFGHVSPTTGDTGDRFGAAGIRSGLMLENVGRGHGAQEIHDALMGSPGHRANILNPQVTHVGLGVVEETGSARSFHVTQLFIQVTARIDAEAAETQLLEAINRARRARGVPPVALEENLSEVARTAAARYFAEPSVTNQDVIDDASRSLRRFGIAYRRVGGLMTIVSDVSEAERLQPTFEEGIGFVGIGVAQGDRPDAPPNSIGVAILMAWPR